MGRMGVVAVAVFSAIVMGMLANSPSAEANCQDKLVGKSFNCNEKDSAGSPSSGCIEFETGGFSDNFDIFFSEGADYGFSCQTTGGFKTPSFNNSSTSVECVEPNTNFELTGALKGKKFSGGGANSSGTDSFVLSCTLSSTPCF